MTPASRPDPNRPLVGHHRAIGRPGPWQVNRRLYLQRAIRALLVAHVRQDGKSIGRYADLVSAQYPAAKVRAMLDMIEYATWSTPVRIAIARRLAGGDWIPDPILPSRRAAAAPSLGLDL